MIFQSKKIKLLFIIIVLFVISVSLYVHKKRQLYDKEKIIVEINGQLPKNLHIIGVEFDFFSIVDGKNYGWLFESQEKVTEWVQNNTYRQKGWEHITKFKEVVPFSNDKIENLNLDSVWKSNSGYENFYLFLAEGDKIFYIETFKP